MDISRVQSERRSFHQTCTDEHTRRSSPAARTQPDGAQDQYFHAASMASGERLIDSRAETIVVARSPPEQARCLRVHRQERCQEPEQQG